MKKIILLGLTVPLLLSACATTQSASKPTLDCNHLDWQAIGVQDGQAGRYPYEISRHQKSCPAIKIDSQVRADWEAGRAQGLKHYCTKANAYALGQYGHQLNQVCPEEGLLEIQQSHALGYQQYYQRNQLNDWFHRPFYLFPWEVDRRYYYW